MTLHSLVLVRPACQSNLDNHLPFKLAAPFGVAVAAWLGAAGLPFSIFVFGSTLRCL